MANNMTDKKKTARSSRSASRAQTVNVNATSGAKESATGAKAVSSAKEAEKEEKSASASKESAKEVKAVSRDRERSKGAANRAAAKAPPSWRVRLRKNRMIGFILDAWYELRHKVTWPTFIEARNMTIIVILLSAAIGLVLGMVDLGLYQLFILISRIP